MTVIFEHYHAQNPASVRRSFHAKHLLDSFTYLITVRFLFCEQHIRIFNGIPNYMIFRFLLSVVSKYSLTAIKSYWIIKNCSFSFLAVLHSCRRITFFDRLWCKDAAELSCDCFSRHDDGLYFYTKTFWPCFIFGFHTGILQNSIGIIRYLLYTIFKFLQRH